MRINIKASYKSAVEWIQQMNALLHCFLMNGVAYTEGRSPAGVWPIYLVRALSPRQRVDHSRKLCVCFYSSLYEVQAAERAQTWISKGEEQALLPLGQRWEGIRHRTSHPWLYSAFVGGQRGFSPPAFFSGGAGATIARTEQFSPNLRPSLHLAGGESLFLS